jgi:hypothetical protein
MFSFTNFMNALGQADPQHGDVVSTPPLQEKSTIPISAGCTIRDTTYELWIAPHHTRASFNLGDGTGQLQPCAIPWTLKTIQSIKPLLPVQTDLNAVAAGYYGTETECPNHPDTHPDHFTVYTAMRTIKLGLPGVQLSVSCRQNNSPVAFPVPQPLYDEITLSRTGAIEKNYGWLTVNSVTNPQPRCCYSFQYVPVQYFFQMPST